MKKKDLDERQKQLNGWNDDYSKFDINTGVNVIDALLTKVNNGFRKQVRHTHVLL